MHFYMLTLNNHHLKFLNYHLLIYSIKSQNKKVILFQLILKIFYY